jgi:multidrug efflux system outer membrane protein
MKIMGWYRATVVHTLLLPILAILSGCTVGQDYTPPEVQSMMQEEYQPPADTGLFSLERQPPELWWEQFHDKELSRLVAQVFTSNRALAQARQRVIEVSARKGVIDADKWLQLSAALGYTHVKTGDEAVSLQGIPPGKTMNVFSTGVVAGWELNLWGRTSRLLEAATEDIRTNYEEYQGLLVSLAAEVTLAYVDARTIQARLEMVRKNIVLQSKSVELARSRFAAGNGTELAVVQAERLLASNRARVPDLERQLTLARNRIKVLLGLPPAAVVLREGKMPAVPSLIGLGLPMDLLTRRPDIRSAFAAYHAAVARIGAAQADQYPTLVLSGSLTLSSDTAGGVFDSDALISSLAPQLKLPIFTGGRIKSNIAVRQAQAEQARLALEQRIVTALAEVENSAASVVRSQQQIEQLAAAEELAKRSVVLARDLYQTGLTDYFQVVDSEQQQLALQESLLLARQQALSQVVLLYRALGGGWQQGPPAIDDKVGNTEQQETTLSTRGKGI